MTASAIASGAGFRAARFYLLDDAGYIDGTQSGSDGYPGRRIEGAKTFQANMPDPQVIRHTGDDRVFATDSLPPTDSETATLTSAKVNLTVDAELSDTEVYALGELQIAVRGTDHQGYEPEVCLHVFRQALNTDDSSANFGKRQWFNTVYPKCRILPKGGGMAEQAGEEDSYTVVPTPVKYAPWGTAISETNEGATEATRLDIISDNPFIIERFDGDGAAVNFLTDFTPISAAKCQAWVDGVLATVSGVSTTLKYVTLSAPPGASAKVVILYEASDLT